MTILRGGGGEMARFFFDVCSQNQRISDLEGSFCNNVGLAYREAQQMIRQMLSAPNQTEFDWTSWWVEVQYADRTTLFRVPFSLG
ncbi:hypothetical protein U8607_13785 [Methylobacterium durans]|uniref:DUF6894 family protein n=1 Tax=Methylobacterium durans TaxID=2202825 RepID=UPI002AFFD935|nr:hypothetical protein [Methylobacterium durans]MEA1833153.1 hypothetical protein [Methylobacterium durans]